MNVNKSRQPRGDRIEDKPLEHVPTMTKSCICRSIRYGGAWRVWDTRDTALRSDYVPVVFFERHAKETRKRMTKMTTMVRWRVKAWPFAACVHKVSSLSPLDHISIPYTYHQHHHALH
jgi:hypothetical protein